jgi:hypothetical protein
MEKKGREKNRKMREKKEKQWSKWERDQMYCHDILEQWIVVPKPPSDDEGS